MGKAKLGCCWSIILAGACLYLSVTGQAEAGERLDQANRPRAQVRIFNLARVPERDLVRAEAEAGRIFGDGGMDVFWTQGDVNYRSSLVTDFSATPSNAACIGDTTRNELRVQLLAHVPRGMPAGTLGFSLPCAKSGIDSTVFIDQCEAVSYHVGPTFARVLGVVIAHELGHVLLRSQQHSALGLMRARWDKSAWLSAAAGQVQVEGNEARRMRAELLRLEALGAAATNPAIDVHFSNQSSATDLELASVRRLR